MYLDLSIIALFIFCYSMLSGRLERSPTSGAILFVAFGLVMGPVGLDIFSFDMDAEGVRTLAEITLALVLFSDASNANLGVLKRSIEIPQRLLLIGLPLTIVLGIGTGVLIFDNLSLFEVAILATMLAPTDAALGKAVVTNESVPSNIREGLNVESGLNDGICVPILFIFLALATQTGEGLSTEMLAISLILEEIGIGLVVGIGLTILCATFIKACFKNGWITETWQQLLVPSMAVACFAVAQALGGSGFIACFAGGLVFGSLAKQHKHKLLLAAEGTGDTFALITWVVFGSAVVGRYLDLLDWNVLLYSVLSLTVVRMLPVFICLLGSPLRTDERLFVGWFGPRGLASIVFGVIVFDEQLPGGGILALTVVCTVLLSIIAHGISANPLAAKLAERLRSANNTH